MKNNYFFSVVIFLSGLNGFSQQPVQSHPTIPQVQQTISNRPPSYVVNLTPLHGGREFNLLRNTKIKATTITGIIAKGKVRDIRDDTLMIDYKYYKLSDLTEIRYNPGTIEGSSAAIATTTGLAAVALTAGGGGDHSMSTSENLIFYSGIALAAVGVAVLVPNYFIKKRFSRTDYNMQTLKVGY